MDRMTSTIKLPLLAMSMGLMATIPTAHADGLPDAIDGWAITTTPHAWQVLGEKVTEAIGASPLNKLSQASATMGAKSLGETIKGNMIIDAFAPNFAIRMLDASIAAGVEAPLRLYITENDDGTASLSYKFPSTVFAPYDDGGDALDELAAELDQIMADIVTAASAP